MDGCAKKFCENIKLLNGLSSWGLVAGPGTGSSVSIEFGGKIPLIKKVDNPYLSSDCQNYDGEYSLFVSCTWRLENKHSIICSCNDDNSADGPMLTGLNQIVNKCIDKVDVSFPSGDLSIFFGEGIVFRVFCDNTNRVDMWDNYLFFTAEEVFTVACGSILSVEPRRRENGSENGSVP